MIFHALTADKFIHLLCIEHFGPQLTACNFTGRAQSDMEQLFLNLLALISCINSLTHFPN